MFMLGEFQDMDLIFLQKLLQMNNSGPNESLNFHKVAAVKMNFRLLLLETPT
jgi:hypothetical protein